ncbi:hypothetical protein [Herpetosiphon geysericola]|uniref:Uncharacterized protein n=1 Tax=Herpetosiphon geysericola TaxID=70996 RepID=A0A0P6XZJ7_9CHLR|nr:hypothetical protein [Herpetosiphon geysericola]KPL81953.1 hypothetical protein SE18_20375 [Herpetosiphon geysericola]
MNDPILDLNIEHIGSLIAKRTFIWQMKFLKPLKIAGFAKDRSVNFWDSHITQLWQLGLLRADLIKSNEEIDLKGLILVNNQKGNYIYVDTRILERSNIKWVESIENLPKIRSNIEILFHPFRYYVLYHLQRVMKLQISPMQILRAKSYPGLLDNSISMFTDWSNTNGFLDVINRWNNISSLAIVTEPFAFIRMFRTRSHPLGFSNTQLYKAIQDHWDEAKLLYQKISLELLQSIHQEISVTVENLDSNVEIHNIIRLSKDDTLRLKVLDNLGGAMYIRTMAEMIRRGIEDVYDIELLEEDGVRYGPASREIKIEEYGAGRLFDHDRKVISEYLKQKHLDYGIRIRWYVEGSTEYGALKKAISMYNMSDIEIRNLRGKFVESKDALSFRESLEQDMSSSIFSFISLDGDRSDNMRVVRKAAETELFLGFFSVSEPDFEFKNFTSLELAEVLWSMAPELHNNLDMKNLLLEIVSDSTNAKDFFEKALSISNQFRVGKGEAWGEKLMEYAMENQKINGETRQILEAIDTSMTIEHDQFIYTKELCRVDPLSGLIIERKVSD